VVQARHLVTATDMKMIFHATARLIETATGTALWTMFTLELMISHSSTADKLIAHIMFALDFVKITMFFEMVLSGV
jgi:hypothetical protein